MLSPRFLACLLATACLSSSAYAADVSGTDWTDAKRFQLRARAIGVVPD